MSMAYVQQSLSPGEEIVCIGHFHWMYTLHAISCIDWGFIACRELVPHLQDMANAVEDTHRELMKAAGL